MREESRRRELIPGVADDKPLEMEIGGGGLGTRDNGETGAGG